jgi:hypothetical protein
LRPHHCWHENGNQNRNTNIRRDSLYGN